MLQMRCRCCRYPIAVAWRGEGPDRELRFYDGLRGVPEDDTKTCPGCGQALLLLEDVEAPEEAE